MENDAKEYGSAALNLHWRESVLGSELMTTALESATAERYTLPASGAGADPAAAARRRSRWPSFRPG